MSEGLASRITEAVKSAMRAHDSTRLSTLRLLQAAIKQKAVDERVQPDDAAILTIIEKQAKQRRESIAAYEAASRPDHVAQEQAELEILKEFMPQAASAEEVDRAVEAAVQRAQGKGLQGGAAIGAVMAELKAALGGRADMGSVSAQVRKQLTH